MIDRSPDVLILGGGIIGLACAHALLRSGRSVTVVEQHTVGSGASHGNCGTITPSVLPLPAPGVIAKSLKWLLKGDAPLRIRPRISLDFFRWLVAFAARCNDQDFRQAARARGELLIASRELLAKLIHIERLECEFVESGTFYVHRDIRHLESAMSDARLLKDIGVAVQFLDGTSARAKEPLLNESVIGGHYYPRDASLRPDRFVKELARIVRSAGGIIHEQTPVQGFHAESGRVEAVISSNGEYRAREVLLTLGAWSPVVAQQLGLNLPIQPGKGYSITYDRARQAPTVPLYLKERAVCVTPLGTGLRLGSTMEFAGYDCSLNRARLSALTLAAGEYLYLPAKLSVREEWFGWRPMTPDDLPILGRAPKLQNVTIATGHGMLGLTLAPITGLLISEILTGRKASVNLAPFSPNRFARSKAN